MAVATDLFHPPQEFICCHLAVAGTGQLSPAFAQNLLQAIYGLNGAG